MSSVGVELGWDDAFSAVVFGTCRWYGFCTRGTYHVE